MEKISTINRFMNFVEFEPNTGCWLWCGGSDKDGYGIFHLGKSVRAHRFSYRYFIGDISKEVKVLHKCDNPPCVNPDHFFCGDTQNNCNDMFLKKRGTKSKKGLPYGVKISPSGKFNSRFTFGGKIMYFGTYGTPEEASEVSIREKLRLINNG